jgi:hypothetical protein
VTSAAEGRAVQASGCVFADFANFQFALKCGEAQGDARPVRSWAYPGRAESRGPSGPDEAIAALSAWVLSPASFYFSDVARPHGHSG